MAKELEGDSADVPRTRRAEVVERARRAGRVPRSVGKALWQVGSRFGAAMRKAGHHLRASHPRATEERGWSRVTMSPPAVQGPTATPTRPDATGEEETSADEAHSPSSAMLDR